MHPSTLGSHRLLAALGHGGMADVYLATTTGPIEFSKLVVIKTLRASLALDAEFVAMFLDEARLAARLNHPNVVQTHTVGSEAGRYFLTMEFLDGQPLSRLMARFTATAGMPVPAVLTLFSAALRGLHYAHELRDYDGTPLNVVHRDVTPQNLFVTYEGQVKVVDFDIAKAVGAAADTRAGMLKGKIGYMPPEQARGDTPDRRADLYSMGVMLWEALAGRRFWNSPNETATLRRLAADDVPFPEPFEREVPGALLGICRRAMAPKREDRYATAQDFRDDLQAVVTNCGALEIPALGALVAEVFAPEREWLNGLIARQLGDADLPVASFETVMSLGGGEAQAHANASASARAHSAARGSAHTPPAAINDVRTVSYTGMGRRPWQRNTIAIAGLTSVLAAGLFTGINLTAREPRIVQSTVAPTKAVNRPNPPPAVTPSGACDAPNKPLLEISGDIDKDAYLSCDKNYLLKFTTYVKSGTTLTIEKGTTITGDDATKGVLVIQPGARIVALGTAEEPIVFTSDSRQEAGSWGGLIILGNAPVNLKDVAGKSTSGRVEGLTSGADYGGNDPNDDSGVLSYVRIEYSGIAIAPNNEINGLTLAGVGRGTHIDHVQVRHTADDCFEFFGGTVDAKYLACQAPGDDGFDWDLGYSGRLQFLAYQASAIAEDDSNGFEGDNDPNASSNTPVSNPTIYNATLCGRRRPQGRDHFGALLRRGTHGQIVNALFVGFDVGLDIRDGQTAVDVRASNFFDNTLANFAVAEDPRAQRGPLADDDDGFDELFFLREPSRGNMNYNMGRALCRDVEHPFVPTVPLSEHAATPPDDGFFDPAARYIGAFSRDENDWNAGNWLRWK